MSFISPLARPARPPDTPLPGRPLRSPVAAAAAAGAQPVPSPRPRVPRAPPQPVAPSRRPGPGPWGARAGAQGRQRFVAVLVVVVVVHHLDDHPRPRPRRSPSFLRAPLGASPAPARAPSAAGLASSSSSSSPRSSSTDEVMAAAAPARGVRSGVGAVAAAAASSLRGRGRGGRRSPGSAPSGGRGRGRGAGRLQRGAAPAAAQAGALGYAAPACLPAGRRPPRRAGELVTSPSSSSSSSSPGGRWGVAKRPGRGAAGLREPPPLGPPGCHWLQRRRRLRTGPRTPAATAGRYGGGRGAGWREERRAAASAAAAAAREPRPRCAPCGSRRPACPGLQLPLPGASCLCCVFSTTALFRERFLAALQSLLSPCRQNLTGFISPTRSLRKSGPPTSRPSEPRDSAPVHAYSKGASTGLVEVRLAVQVRLLKEEICHKSSDDLLSARLRLLLSLYEISRKVYQPEIWGLLLT